jgi:hypothetical protein
MYLNAVGNLFQQQIYNLDSAVFLWKKISVFLCPILNQVYDSVSQALVTMRELLCLY